MLEFESVLSGVTKRFSNLRHFTDVNGLILLNLFLGG